MPVKLDSVVPWGRSLEEYCLMFSLEETDLAKRIVGCADGPASFNAGMRERGAQVVSLDPVYAFSGEEIAARFVESVSTVMDQVRASEESWVWDYHRNPDRLLQHRQRALEWFLKDFEAGKREGRYRVGELPGLDFRDGEFDLALCSHFLFLYSAHLSFEFHLASILEMCRVAREVRIFPLLTLDQNESPYLPRILEELRGRGFRAKVKRVDYEFQKGGNQGLFIESPAHADEAAEAHEGDS